MTTHSPLPAPTDPALAARLDLGDDVELPKELLEPARRLGRKAIAILGVVTVGVSIALPVADVVPEQYRARFVAIVLATGAGAAAATKLFTELVRGKVAPAWKIRRIYEDWEQSIKVTQEGDRSLPGPRDHVWNPGGLLHGGELTLPEGAPTPPTGPPPPATEPNAVVESETETTPAQWPPADSGAPPAPTS